MQGRVLGEDGRPVAGATVRVIDTTSGRGWGIATQSDGRFLLEAVAVGTYRVEVRALGRRPETRSDVAVALGQRVALDFVLRSAAVELPAVTVSPPPGTRDRGRTGPAEIISRAEIEDLPNLGRSFFPLAALSPQVVFLPPAPAVPTGGMTFGGQNRLYNSFQIDGGMEQDLFLGQLPGRQAFPRPLSLEAVEEIQVLTAPFDVRQGNFAGGLVNLVTRSGGNALHGSAFGYLADDALVRRNLMRPSGEEDLVQPFTTWQIGGTVGGPIVRDRAHYFASVDWQQRAVPDPGPLVTDYAGTTDSTDIGLSYASAVRFRDILQSRYGLDPGTFGPVPGRVPARDIFGKISLQIATNSQMDATYHYAGADRQDFVSRLRHFYALSSFTQREPSTTHAARLVWRSVFAGRWSNELLLGGVRLRDECQPAATFPELRVQVGPKPYLTAGVSNTCPHNTLRQDVLQLTDNATLGLGPHALSVGLHAQLMRFQDDLVQGSPGLWIFSSLDALEAGLAQRYQRTLRGQSWDGVDFRALQLGVYAQDRWNPSSRLTLTFGLRLDVPFLPDAIPTYAPLRNSLGIDTGHLPSGKVLWSPRVGINYDVAGDGRTFLRGGVGLFSGPPLYRWLGNLYRDDGTQELVVACAGAVPFDPANQPSACTTPRPQLSAFAPGTRFPQNLKVAAGVDHRLFGVLVGTLDLVYTRSVHQLYVTDANLAPPSGASFGEADRPLYGAINPANGTATASRLDTAFGQVMLISNRDGDHALSLAAQLRTQTGGVIEGSVLYAYTQARDRMSLAHVQARSMLEGTMLEGTLEDRRLGVSWFEVPHRAQATASVQLPYHAALALLYAGASGRPFSYSVNKDANADGLGVTLWQDPVYVPRDSSDITLANAADWHPLDSLITAIPCLRSQRGRLLRRNSCRNPWFGTLSARLRKTFPTSRGQALQASATLYNMLNLINRRWGLSRYDAATFGYPLLNLRGYDVGAGRGLYSLMDPPKRQIEDLPSRWQMELSVRYVF